MWKKLEKGDFSTSAYPQGHGMRKPHPHGKLSPSQIEAIRNSDLPQAILARNYRVSVSTINGVINRQQKEEE
jgi:DNA-binding transcriptional regulator YiaG